uniref:Uncharacterized protein n=1 Tax=Wuchereria bancrofti TaxID=6293 RepID=A0A1I8EUS0_WUCBA
MHIRNVPSLPGAVGLITCLPYYKSNNPIEWWNVYYFSTGIHITATGSALTAYKINRCAGLLMVPYVLWTAFHTIGHFIRCGKRLGWEVIWTTNDTKYSTKKNCF